ncbi:MAG TPA: hypothetical protein VLA43_12200 [Longimicrobiales bacterium]|nr:hypothetical protein [Longimicrobiales bacterium]
MDAGFASGVAADGGQFDGIEFLQDGRVLVSDWGTSCIHANEVRVIPLG